MRREREGIWLAERVFVAAECLNWEAIMDLNEQRVRDNGLYATRKR